MTITVIFGDKGNVDFSSPIQLDEDKRVKLLSFLNNLFLVEMVETEDFRTWRIAQEGRIQYPHLWTAKEYAFMLKSNSIIEIVEKLGRSGMSVIVQDGWWRPIYLNWCKVKGKEPFGENMVVTIEEFMKEKKDLVMAKKQKKKLIKRKEKEIEDLKDSFEHWDLEKTRQQIDLSMRLQKIPTEGIDAYIQRKKQEINSEIQKLMKDIELLRKNSGS